MTPKEVTRSAQFLMCSIFGSIDVKTYNEVIFSKSAIYDSKELCEKLMGLGLSIDKVSLRGSTYEIKAIRLQ